MWDIPLCDVLCIAVLVDSNAPTEEVLNEDDEGHEGEGGKHPLAHISRHQDQNGQRLEWCSPQEVELLQQNIM